MNQEKMSRVMDSVQRARTQSEVENLIEKAAKEEGILIDLSLESYGRVAKKLEESGHYEFLKVLQTANNRWCELSA